MKLKSLILGSVAAAGLSTAGYAADLGVLTSLDICDSLGISGLTISSSDNCLKITGGVKYEFNWGDYAGTLFPINTTAGAYNVADNDSAAGLDNDWSSRVEAWLTVVGTASSDFGPASVTIKLKSVQHTVAQNEVGVPGKVAPWGAAVVGAGGDETFGVILDEAYVSVGDTTVIMAGRKGTIANRGDDEPLNWLGLFNSEKVDTGVAWLNGPALGSSHAIQIVSAVADGVTVKAGLEQLQLTTNAAGTAVGVVEYAGNGIKAHITGAAGGILDGIVERWGVHAGFVGSFDQFKVVAAGAFNGDNLNNSYWNILGSASATFDIFEIALSGEANGGYDGVLGANRATQAGFGGSVGATVTEGVKFNLGARWFDENTGVANTESYQIAARIIAAISETLSVTGEVGIFGTNKPVGGPVVAQTDFYGAAELAWAPGGGFTSSLKGEAHQSGAYKVTFKAAKEFK